MGPQALQGMVSAEILTTMEVMGEVLLPQAVAEQPALMGMGVKAVLEVMSRMVQTLAVAGADMELVMLLVVVEGELVLQEALAPLGLITVTVVCQGMVGGGQQALAEAAPMEGVREGFQVVAAELVLVVVLAQSAATAEFGLITGRRRYD